MKLIIEKTQKLKEEEEMFQEEKAFEAFERP